MFKFSLNYDTIPTERPAFTKMIDILDTITLNNGYTLQIDDKHLSVNIIKLKKEGKNMSMLTEKRVEIQKKLDNILNARAAAIDSKLAIYKAQLEAEPIPAEAIELKKVLAAIDEVIAYDSAYAEAAKPEITVVPVQPEIQVETVEVTCAKPEVIATSTQAEVVKAVPVVETATIPAGEVLQSASRPGMAEINVPNRG